MAAQIPRRDCFATNTNISTMIIFHPPRSLLMEMILVTHTRDLGVNPRDVRAKVTLNNTAK